MSANSVPTKTDLGLGNVDNTSDASKPVSTATTTALALKAPLASPTFTGTPAAPTATVGTNTTQLATTAFVLANAGGGGGMAVGGAVSGGVAGAVLYEDGSGNLAATAGLTYDGSTLTLGGAYPAVGNLTLHANNPTLTFYNTGTTATGYLTVSGTSLYLSGLGFSIGALTNPNDLTTFNLSAGLYYISAGQFSVNSASPRGQVSTLPASGSVAAFAADQAGLIMTAPAFGVFADSTTTSSRYVGGLYGAWASNTDASRKGRLALKAADSTGTDREGVRVESDGAQALIGFFGATATARPAVTGSKGGNAALASLLTALAAFGLITDSTS